MESFGVTIREVDKQNFHLTVYIGATVSFALSNFSTDITGWDAEMCFKASIDSEPIAIFTVDNSRVEIDEINRRIIFTMSAADSLGLPPIKNGVFGIKLINGSGVVFQEIGKTLELKKQAC